MSRLLQPGLSPVRGKTCIPRIANGGSASRTSAWPVANLTTEVCRGVSPRRGQTPEFSALLFLFSGATPLRL